MGTFLFSPRFPLQITPASWRYLHFSCDCLRLKTRAARVYVQVHKCLSASDAAVDWMPEYPRTASSPLYLHIMDRSTVYPILYIGCFVILTRYIAYREILDLLCIIVQINVNVTYIILIHFSNYYSMMKRWEMGRETKSGKKKKREWEREKERARTLYKPYES